MHLNFHRQGQGPAIVLIHGLLGSRENLNGIAKSLAKNFDVIAVDLPNHGLSPHRNEISYHLMAADITQLMTDLGIEKYALLGHSMGGKVAMQLAIDHPEKVKKLIVVDVAPVAYPAKHNNIFNALGEVDLTALGSRKDADRFLQPLIPEHSVRQFLLKSLVRQNDRFIWRFNLKGLMKNYHHISKSIHGNGSYLGPTLFVKGGNSDYIAPQHRPSVLNHFPNSKARIISDTGHWPHAEKPELFNRVVNSFLLS
jgi:esterase